jgi:long-subunit acyl-CoA synthetase (AMP-forming)
LCLLPLSTLLENIGGIYYPLLADGTVLLPTESETGFFGSTGLDIVAMLQAISGHQPTSIILLPQMLVGLVAALQSGWRPPPQLKFAAVGGAKVAPGLLLAAREYGFPVYEGYGLSESASVACLNRPGDDLIGSVGRPLEHIELTLEGGEIVLSGNSFLGYLGQPDTWAQPRVFTGDLGERDAEGFVHLKGRSKNLLISSFGRNISPEWVESELLMHPEIGQCVVFGDSRPYCSALIAASGPGVEDSRIQACVDASNKNLPDYARVKRWYRLARPLEHRDGLFTDNGRPRRNRIAEQFATEIDSLYASDSAGIRANSDSGTGLKRISM